MDVALSDGQKAFNTGSFSRRLGLKVKIAVSRLSIKGWVEP